jgi:multidrug efflux pump subunit AcrB
LRPTTPRWNNRPGRAGACRTRSGILLKNAIALIDRIDVEIREGKDPYDAVIDSGVSRMRPVMMAAATTVLGTIPLVPDAFYVSMAVTITSGLSFAAVLTLIVVPVLYTIFFRIPRRGPADRSSRRRLRREP